MPLGLKGQFEHRDVRLNHGMASGLARLKFIVPGATNHAGLITMFVRTSDWKNFANGNVMKSKIP